MSTVNLQVFLLDDTVMLVLDKDKNVMDFKTESDAAKGALYLATNGFYNYRDSTFYPANQIKKIRVIAE